MTNLKNLAQQVAVCLVIIWLWRSIEAGTSQRWEDTFASSDKGVVEIATARRTPAGPLMGRGTGFVLVHDGRPLIVTNEHVTEGADEITIVFSDKMTATAQLIDASSDRDIAVLGVDNVDLMRYLTLSRRSSRDLRIGDELMTIGCPLGESHQLSLGLYTGVEKVEENEPPLMRLSMALDPGNSGGPLLDQKGRVVGVVAAKRGGSSSIAYAVPIEQLDTLRLR